MRKLVLIVAAAAAAPATALSAAPAFAHGGADPVSRAAGVPVNNPVRGLIYDGLARATSGRCAHAFKVVNSDACTHGPDPAPAGVDVNSDASPVVFQILAALPKVQCDGDGVSGKRVQVLYVHAPDVADRYSTYANSIRQWAADADKIYRNSAAETSGERHIRFVHTASCILPVADVTLQTAAGDDSLSNTQAQLKNLGYNRSDRKYMLFEDAHVYCGIGNIRGDDSPGSANLNNGGPSYGRTDAGCWGGRVPAHELMHNLGGVQLSAPHSSGGWHCIDEYDRMCYSDAPNYPTMIYLCTDPNHENLFDCNHDDYFNTRPPTGSYLATHWNAVNSQYLVPGPLRVWGYVWANDPTSASYTPSTYYQRNSTGALNTIQRTGVGAYTVTFANLGIYYGGTVDVTAYNVGSQACKVGSWVPSLADMKVYVRCFDSAGAAADAQFVASFTRPVVSSRFAYVWANMPTSPAYTPNSYYRFNSAGGTNTITRLGMGFYRVRLPSLGGSGGSVKVTAYGYRNEYCKVGSWTYSGTDEFVNVLCQTPAGAAVDTRFTMTFHGPIGLLGVPMPKRAYVWADQPLAASYTPSLAYQYNSAGGTNTITRSSIGVYRVRLPGLATSGGHVQVSAYGSGSARCKVASWIVSGADELVNVRCFSASGAVADTRYVVGFVS